MTPVERRRIAIEYAVDGVHDRGGDAVGHRQRGEPGVVMQNVERQTLLGREVDLLPRPRDMVGLVQRGADLVRMSILQQRVHTSRRPRSRRGEQRHLMATLDQSLAQQGNDRLDPAVAGRRHLDPRRREDGDPQPISASVLGAKQPEG